MGCNKMSRSSDTPGEKVADATAGGQRSQSKPRILIVDDSLTVRMDLGEAFESAGFSVNMAENLLAARNALARHTFSLALLDVLLQDGDGIDLLREIRATPATADLPVMLLSTEAE